MQRSPGNVYPSIYMLDAQSHLGQGELKLYTICSQWSLLPGFLYNVHGEGGNVGLFGSVNLVKQHSYHLT